MKVLIVDDNKMLAKAMGRKVGEALSCEVDLAHDAASAQAMMDENDYFAALLDLCLPDAMHGEVVDAALERKMPSIILTGLDDEDTRSKFMDKPIIDYVLKEGASCVDYIIEILERLIANSKVKIIVAEDSTPVRTLIKSSLQAYRFDVLAAAHGEEALCYLENNPDVKIIITDKEMPVLSGEELIKEVRKEYSKNELSIIVLTGHNDEATAARMLKLGANDFISKPFARESLICRLNNHVDILNYISHIKDASERDFLTKLRNRKSFFEQAEQYYEEISDERTFAVLMIDIDNFKSINDNFGHAIGDEVLIKTAKVLNDYTRGADIVSRFGGEEFCIVLKNIKLDDAYKIAEKLRLQINQIAISTKKGTAKFTISVGLCSVNKSTNIEAAIKLADEALYQAKDSGKNKVVVSDN